MWPWGHLAVAYLGYRTICFIKPTSTLWKLTIGTVLAVSIGALFPDLVDKPLAWSLSILPSGRSLAHSLLTLTVITSVGWRLATHNQHRRLIVAFAFGAFSHSLSDLGPETVAGLVVGDWAQLTWTTYLFWPVLPSPPYPNDTSLISHLEAFTLTPFVLAQLLLFCVVGILWYLDHRAEIEAAVHDVQQWIAAK